MTINVQCPGCGKSLRGKVEFAGKRVKCPKCGHSFLFTPPIESHASLTETSVPTAAIEMRLLDVQWQPKTGVIVSQAKTYGCGIGSEYVYCYSYPTYVEMAELKKEKYFRIKVGSAIGDPIERIYQQFAGSKTALSEAPVVLLVFQTLAARHLERWLHKQLDRAHDAGGSEWFHTNLNELVELYRRYLRDASLPPNEPTQSESAKKIRGVRRKEAGAKPVRVTGPATSENDVVVVLRKPVPRTGEPATERMRQGHRIQEVMNKGPVSVGEICNQTGCSFKRVLGHVNYEINVRKRAQLVEPD